MVRNVIPIRNYRSIVHLNHDLNHAFYRCFLECLVYRVVNLTRFFRASSVYEYNTIRPNLSQNHKLSVELSHRATNSGASQIAATAHKLYLQVARRNEL
jgi:hypothetical protein